MDENSAGAPEFVLRAEEIQSKLAPVATAEAMGMARAARDLAETFRSWEKKRPTDATRIAAIQQLMALNRQVMDYLALRSKPKGKGSSPP